MGAGHVDLEGAVLLVGEPGGEQEAQDDADALKADEQKLWICWQPSLREWV